MSTPSKRSAPSSLADNRDDKRHRTMGVSSPATDTPNKASKGLRHFSMRVCKKVEEKGTTSYNEVADELVAECIEQERASTEGDPDVDTSPTKKKKQGGGSGKGYDEKNIRRRVYDALNVLMAMDIIAKNRKEITWKGLPSNAQHDIELLQSERRAKLEEIRKKQECLQELLVQNICFNNLVKRNKNRKEVATAKAKESAAAAAAVAAAPPTPAFSGVKTGTGNGDADTSCRSSKTSDKQIAATSPPSTSVQANSNGTGGKDGAMQTGGRDPPPKSVDTSSSTNTGGWGSTSCSASGSGSNFPVPLPFIVVNTSSQAVIKCDMNPDRTDVMFDFSLPFEINDDNEILKRLQLDKTTVEDAGTLFPQDLFTYAQEHRLLEHVLVTPDKMPSYNDTGVASQEESAVTLGERHGPAMAVEEGPAADLSRES